MPPKQLTFEESLAYLRSSKEHSRTAAAHVLSGFRDPRALQPLADALQRAETIDEKWEMWDAIGELGGAEQYGHLACLFEAKGWKVRPEDRVAALEPPSKPTRKLPANEIEKIKADIADFTSASIATRWRAISRLGRRRGQIIELLAEATASPNVLTRFHALNALYRIGDPRTYPVVLAMTKDPYLHTRWDAWSYLGKIGGERAIPVLIEALRTANADSAKDLGAPRGLVDIGEPAIAPLVEVLATGSNRARISAAFALRLIGDERAVEPIARLLDDPDSEVRLAGVENLALLGEDYPQHLGARCLGLIQRMTNDPTERMRECAAYWIEQIKEALADA